MILIIMGVSGCGKTTLGEKVAEVMGIPYYEADAFHPEENIRKMSGGIPLTDDDRWPWLSLIREEIKACQKAGRSAVFTCSALKESYRVFLGDGLDAPLTWVYLRGAFDVIHRRLEARRGHYQKAGMLKSQFADLEEPGYGLSLDVEEPLEEKVRKVCALAGTV